MTNAYAYPPAPAPAPARRWWHHPALIIALLVVFPPGGIALAWTSRWSKGKKIVATVLAGLWFLAPFLGDPPKKTEADAKPNPAASATPTAPAVAASPSASTTPTLSASPSPTATAPKELQIPDVVGATYDDAMKALEKAGIRKDDITLEDVYLDIDTPTHAKAAGDPDWKVCFQTPGKDTKVKEGTAVRLDLGEWSEFDLVKNCPAAKGTTYKIPANDPNYHRDETWTDSSTSGGSSSGGSSSTGGGGNVYYKNCTAVRAAGAAPIRRGDPGYGSHLDRDGDGVACE